MQDRVPCRDGPFPTGVSTGAVHSSWLVASRLASELTSRAAQGCLRGGGASGPLLCPSRALTQPCVHGQGHYEAWGHPPHSSPQSSQGRASHPLLGIQCV